MAQTTGFSINQASEFGVVQNSVEKNSEADSYEAGAFRLINFKAFRDTGWIGFNRLTLVPGENSSGKSALYQALQMVSNAYDCLMQEDKFTNLAPMSEKFGNFKDLCNKLAEEPVVQIFFQFQNKDKLLECYVSLAPDEENEYGRVTDVLGVQGKETYHFLRYYDSVNLFF